MMITYLVDNMGELYVGQFTGISGGTAINYIFL
jgi:hypothetical protein